MKKMLRKILPVSVAALVFSTSANADIQMPVFGGNSGGLEFSTTFAGDLNDGSTGLYTDMGCDLWFEFTPYTDVGLIPRKNKLSVSLQMNSTAAYAWRGYTFNNDGVSMINDKGSVDQAKSLWFNTLTASLAYGPWWLRVAGIDPQITMNQASIKSVMDNVMAERTGDKNQYFRLPLFHSGGPYSGNGGTVSVIARDLVHLTRREVEIYGMYSAGFSGLDYQADLKAGSWKNGENNDDNSWVFGGDFYWKPAFNQQISFSALYAINYTTYIATGLNRETLQSDDDANTATVVQSAASDPESDSDALTEAPLALGIGYEYSLDIAGFGVLKPYAGFDFIYQTDLASSAIHDDYDWEVGGGLMWLFRGTGANYKWNYKLGGMQLSGDTSCQVGLGAGFNVNKDGIINGIISFNEDPSTSPLAHIGGFMQMELMNVGGKKYTAANGTTYNDFLWAVIAQLEWQATNHIMPYIFGWYVPSVNYGAAYTDSDGNTRYSRYAYQNYNDDPTYEKGSATITTKIGCKLTPYDHFYMDMWYERTDQKSDGEWSFDKGLLSICFGIKL